MAAPKSEHHVASGALASVFEEQVALWAAGIDPGLRVDRGHECVILRSDEDDHGVIFKQLDRDWQVCAAHGLGGGPIAFGSSTVAIAGAAELSVEDPWVGAVVAAIERERRWPGGPARQSLTVSLGSGELVHVTASVNRASI